MGIPLFLPVSIVFELREDRNLGDLRFRTTRMGFSTPSGDVSGRDSVSDTGPTFPIRLILSDRSGRVSTPSQLEVGDLSVISLSSSKGLL